MNKFLKAFITISMLFLTIAVAQAQTFIVRKIEIEGLQRVTDETVLHYLPIKIGQTFDSNNSTKIINALYQTNFFTNVNLFRNGNILIIQVEERPTISDITITGNKQIPDAKLNEALSKLGLEKGRFLSHATLDEVKQALQNQYYATGRYNAKVDIIQTPEPRNRVAISIKISEGAVTKVANIKIIGATIFPESQLLDQLQLSTPSFTTFFTRKDEYSADKLQQSEQSLQNFYMDHGYIRVKVNSAEATLTPDKKHVDIIIKITEGDQYRISGVNLSGNLLNQTDALRKVILIKPGDIFSRQTIINDVKTMTTILGNQGYAFATVEPQPQIDDQDKKVFINFNVQPGQKYYVRKIIFSGNDTTSQLALRQQFYAMEGSLYSTQKIHDSLYQLQQDSYLSQEPPIQVVPQKVAGTNDMLDLQVNVAEKLAAQFQLSLGYSEAYGFLVSTGITQSNFMGTGKTVGFNINVSSYQKSFSFSYINPYYTLDGVSRSITVYGTQTSSDKLSIAEYNTDSYGLNVGYGFPLSVYSSLNLGYGVARTVVKPGNTPSNTVTSFINNYGSFFDQLLLTAGWSRHTTDRPILPTKGTQQAITLTISAPIDQYMLEYYKVDYTHDWFQPLGYFILNTHGIVGYGNGYGAFSALPFFQNYYAGGLGVQGINRAYYPFSLGPRDSSGNPIGGNLLIDGHVSLILPDFFHTPTVRTSIFLDGGNAFTTDNGQNPVRLTNLRYSYGAQVEWWTPLNLPLIFSIAEPINNQSGDQLDAFQFTIGTMY